MLVLTPQYITDEQGKAVAAVLPIKEFKIIIEILENLDDLKMSNGSTREQNFSTAISTEEIISTKAIEYADEKLIEAPKNISDSTQNKENSTEEEIKTENEISQENTEIPSNEISSNEVKIQPEITNSSSFSTEFRVGDTVKVSPSLTLLNDWVEGVIIQFIGDEIAVKDDQGRIFFGTKNFLKK